MQRPFSSAPGSRSGFSLVEVMLALLVLTGTVLAYGAMELQTVQLAGRNAAMTPESTAAAAKLEELTRLPYAKIVSGSEQAELANGERVLLRWKVAADTPVVGAKTVTVAASMSGVVSVPASLTTVLTDLGGGS